MFDLRPPASHLVRQSDELGFDGNHNDLVVDWCVPKEGARLLTRADLASMLRATRDGHLAWVCVPPEGYRI